MTWECRTPSECESVEEDERIDADDTDTDVSDSSDSDSDTSERRTYKDDSTLRDQQSTGRKRAARWYPLDELAACEWQMKKNCGGGQHPITGCAIGLQQARHHGPDKNTLNNDKGNVHRICHSCHNRWHTLNDPDYVWGDVQNLHDPETCGVEDIVANEKFWEGRAVVKAKD